MPISIVIPAYNEARRIPQTLDAIDAYMKSRAVQYEVIVVDDGSSDGTAKVVTEKAENTGNIRLIQNPTNKGKGFSARRGVLSAVNDQILISDADLSTPIEEMDKFAPYFSQGYDIIIGSRALTQSDIIRRQPWHRRTMGKTFNALVRAIVMDGIRDTQCGFKMFRQAPARRIFKDLATNRYAFDVEILLRARQMGYKTMEIPVRWRNSPHSNISIIRDSFRMLIDLILMRIHLGRPSRKGSGP